MIVKRVRPFSARGRVSYDDCGVRRLLPLRAVKCSSKFHALIKEINLFEFQFTPLMIILDRLDVPGYIACRLSLPCIIKGLSQLWRDQTGLAMTQARAVKLHEAKPEN